jgi:hypothetical protein
MSKTPETFGEDEAPTPLACLGDVQRALAKTLRKIERGTVKHDVGQVLINGYGTLAKLMQDARDSRWLPRVKEMWAEREQAKQAPSESVQ